MEIITKNNYSIEAFHNAIFIDSSIKERPLDLHSTRIDHLNKALSHKNNNGLILEFGVWKGTTINEIAKQNPKVTIHGFDSFEGLPEDWETSFNSNKNKHKKGYFSLNNLPTVEKNVKLWKGWFENTIPIFIKDYKDTISFLHIDGDLYSSAIIVLNELNHLIVPGTVIVFDEFYPWGRKSYARWREGEFKALNDWINKYSREFKVLYRSNHQQCSIEITK